MASALATAARRESLGLTRTPVTAAAGYGPIGSADMPKTPQVLQAEEVM
jgi:hypothetical protein